MNKIFDFNNLLVIKGSCHNHAAKVSDDFGELGLGGEYAFESEESVENLGFRIIRRI